MQLAANKQITAAKAPGAARRVSRVVVVRASAQNAEMVRPCGEFRGAMRAPMGGGEEEREGRP